ncbi:MAG: DUF6125 family protein [Candidatus Bathyarchaeia archaeon]
MEMTPIENLEGSELKKIVGFYSKSLLTIDGLWFLAVEDRFGLKTATRMDVEVWGRFGSIEAKRIMRTFDLTEGGIESIVKALQLSPTWAAMRYEFPTVTVDSLVFRIVECPPQRARIRKGRGEFPCKPVGLSYLREFARTIDPRAKVEALTAPPDAHPEEFWCEWRLTV